MELSETSMERIVESIWVATLAGIIWFSWKNTFTDYNWCNIFFPLLADIAQTSLLRTPKKMESFGPAGQWNCTLCPREYELATREHSMLTNAEFYGGVDGKDLETFQASWATGVQKSF